MGSDIKEIHVTIPDILLSVYISDLNFPSTKIENVRITSSDYNENKINKQMSLNLYTNEI